MTKKDYELIAAALKLSADTGFESHYPGIVNAAHAIADALAQDNPRFDRARFLKAAGVAS